MAIGLQLAKTSGNGHNRSANTNAKKISDKSLLYKKSLAACGLIPTRRPV